MKEGIGGSGVEFSSYTPYVGLGVVRPLMANPTNEDYERITGKKCPYSLSYELYKNQEGDTFFPIRLLVEVQETGRYEFLQFYISNRPRVSQSGKMLFVNQLGEFAWGASMDALRQNERMDWFTKHEFEPACEGIRVLYTMLQALVKYDSRSNEADWLRNMVDYRCTGQYLFERMDVSGLNELLDWCNKQDHAVICLFAVKESEKDGKKYQNQVLVTGRNEPFFFRTELRGPNHAVSDYVVKLVRDMHNEAKARGYGLTSHEYYVGPLKKFVDETMPSEDQVAEEDTSVLAGAVDDAV